MCAARLTWKCGPPTLRQHFLSGMRVRTESYRSPTARFSGLVYCNNLEASVGIELSAFGDFQTNHARQIPRDQPTSCQCERTPGFAPLQDLRLS